jgi:renalase
VSQNERRIAIIGAGISGLSCATLLNKNHVSATIFDKSRGPGGRMSTRRKGESKFDHGAQYFTASHEDFLQQLIEWETVGLVAQWAGRFANWQEGHISEKSPKRKRWVGVPRMSALCRGLSQGLQVRYGVRIHRIEPMNQQWFLVDENERSYEPFDSVIVSCPGPQAAALLPVESHLHQHAKTLTYSPCWAVMAELESTINTEFDGIHFQGHPLGWAAKDSSKPQRARGERWVLHASAKWSQQHVDTTPEVIIQKLTQAFNHIGNIQPQHCTAHRWLYALASHSDGSAAMYDQHLQLGLCGDALSEPKVEGAWRSGQQMAKLILEST